MDGYDCLRFAVRLKRYHNPSFEASQHRSVKAAIRALGSHIRGRKHRVRDLEQAWIWFLEDNNCYPLERAKELAESGYFDQ